MSGFNHDSVVKLQPQKKGLISFSLTDDTTLIDSTFFSDGANISLQSFIEHENFSHPLVDESMVRSRQDWIAGIILGCFIIFVWMRLTFGNRLQQILDSFRGRNYANQFIREGNLFSERIFLPLMIIAMLSYSLFLYQSVACFGDASMLRIDFVFYLELLTGILVYWLTRVILIRISGFVFRTQALSYNYLFNAHIFFIISGLAILPLLILASFLELRVFMIASIILLGGIFLLWLFRGISIGLNEKAFSRLHLFLYLCTLEFLPLIILAKIVVDSKIF